MLRRRRPRPGARARTGRSESARLPRAGRPLSAGAPAVGRRGLSGFTRMAARRPLGLGKMALREQHDTQIVLRPEVRSSRTLRAGSRRNFQPSAARNALPDCRARPDCWAERRPSRSSRWRREVALRLQCIAEGEMARGTGIEPDRRTEALIASSSGQAGRGWLRDCRKSARPVAQSPAATAQWPRRAAPLPQRHQPEELRVGVPGASPARCGRVGLPRPSGRPAGRRRHDSGHIVGPTCAAEGSSIVL
jgi:hypothetical protein